MTHTDDIRFDDPVTDLLFRALVQARAARRLLEDDIPLLIPHTRRSFAASIAGRCTGDGLFDGAFERDLDAFIAQLDTQVAAETRVEIQCDPDTGVSWEDPHLTPTGDILQRAATTLRRLRTTLDVIADAATAEVMRGGF